MKKSIAALIVTACSLFTQQALAESACYPLAHGENGMGTLGELPLPAVITRQEQWTSWIYLTNVTDQHVNVKITHKRSNGQPYLTNADQSGAWSDAVSPIYEWTILEAGETAAVAVRADDINDFLSGKIEWQALSCINHALTASVRNVYSGGHGYDQGFVLLNNGLPF